MGSPTVGRVPTYLELKPYVSTPPPLIAKTNTHREIMHTSMSVPPLFTSYTCVFETTTVTFVGSKSQIPTVKDTRFVTGARRRHPKRWFLCPDQRQHTGKHMLQHQAQGTHRLRWHQPIENQSSQDSFPILHCRVPQPYPSPSVKPSTRRTSKPTKQYSAFDEIGVRQAVELFRTQKNCLSFNKC